MDAAAARLADAHRAMQKELQRCYGARGVEWWHHRDPTMQAIADEYRAALADSNNQSRQPAS